MTTRKGFDMLQAVEREFYVYTAWLASFVQIGPGGWVGPQREEKF